MLSYAKKQVLAELQEVLLFELGNLVSAFNVECVAGRLYRKRVQQVKVAMYAKARTVFLVFFVSELAVVELKVCAVVVQYHGEPPNNFLLLWVLYLRAEYEN